MRLDYIGPDCLGSILFTSLAARFGNNLLAQLFSRPQRHGDEGLVISHSLRGGYGRHPSFKSVKIMLEYRVDLVGHAVDYIIGSILRVQRVASARLFEPETKSGASTRMLWRSPDRISSRDPAISSCMKHAMRVLEPTSYSPVAIRIGVRIACSRSPRSLVENTV